MLDGKFGNDNDDRLTPGGCVYLLSRCLERFDQPVQLRVVLSLLGLEPDTARLFSLLDKNGDELDELDELDTVEEDGDTNERPTQSQTIDDRFHRTILYFLNTVASNSTMDWVRAISTIVRNKLFFPPNQKPHSTNPITEERIDPLLKRTIEDILDSVTNAAVQAHELSSRADFCIAQKHEQKEEEDEHEHDDDDDEDETVHRREQRMDELLDSFGLNLDRNPLYAPYGYSLCNPVLLKRAVPELFPIDSHNDNDTTTTNTNNDDGDDEGSATGGGGYYRHAIYPNAPILQIDTEIERKRVEEELKRRNRGGGSVGNKGMGGSGVTRGTGGTGNRPLGSRMGMVFVKLG